MHHGFYNGTGTKKILLISYNVTGRFPITDFIKKKPHIGKFYFKSEQFYGRVNLKQDVALKSAVISVSLFYSVSELFEDAVSNMQYNLVLLIRISILIDFVF